MPNIPTAPTVWVIQRKSFVGDCNAAVGVAERLTPDHKLIYVEDIEAAGGMKAYLAQMAERGEITRDTYPDVVIGSSAPATSVQSIIELKRLSKEHTFAVFLRDPKELHRQFDLIVMPEHQAAVSGRNYIACTGIPHRVTPFLLEKGRNEWKGEFSHYDNMKKIAVMIGGNSLRTPEETGGGEMTADDGRSIGKELNAIAKQHNACLLVTNSSRTPRVAWEALCSELTDTPAYLHDYKLDAARGNPYFGLLAHADILIPTADSMSMCSECCSIDKPVFIAGMHCHNVRSDHKRLADQLIEHGYARPIEQHNKVWEERPAPLDTAGDIAEAIKGFLRHKLMHDAEHAI